MQPKIVTLSRPLKTKDGRHIETLTMREPLVRDMRTSRKGESDPSSQEVVLFANLCEVTPDDIDALPIRDYDALQNAFRGFAGSAGT